jgi:hypothetical protein
MRPFLFALCLAMAAMPLTTANTQNVEYVGSYDTPGSANDIFVAGDYAYVADGSSGLQIINISDPSIPTLTGSYDTQHYASGVFLVGNCAYVVDDFAGLQIINISNPSSPTLVGSYDTPGFAFGVFVTGNNAYVADDICGLQIINISDPSSPTLVGSYDTPDCAFGVFVDSNYAYVADLGSGLQIIDISNPSSPTLVGRLETVDARRVFVDGNYAYVADAIPGLKIIDISDPSNPAQAGSYVAPGSALGVFVAGDYIYVANDSSMMILRFNPTGISYDNTLPNTFSLFQNYPNPFNARTTIAYSISQKSEAEIDIFDILGKKIAGLSEGIKEPGAYQIVWDASGVSSGIYFYRIKAGDCQETKRMTLIK